MVRLQVWLREKQAIALRHLPASQNVSAAALIWQAVDHHLLAAGGMAPGERSRRALSVVGHFHSGLSGISAADDDYLATAYQ
jgi:hypothetical protein